MTEIHGARLKYLRNSFTMLEMALQFDKQFMYVGNDVCMWEWLKDLRNGKNMWEMTQICGKFLKYVRKQLNYLT